MNEFNIASLVVRKEVGDGLIAMVWKDIHDAAECKLCERVDGELQSVGSLTILASSESPNISIVVCLPVRFENSVNIDSVAGRILNLLGKPEDETFQAALYFFDDTLTKFSSRRSNARQSSSWL